MKPSQSCCHLYVIPRMVIPTSAHLRQGSGASVDHSRCDACPEGFYGTEGFCLQCANGTQPRNLSEAAWGPDGLAGFCLFSIFCECSIGLFEIAKMH